MKKTTKLLDRRVTEIIPNKLLCPVCKKGKLNLRNKFLSCKNKNCLCEFPLIDKIPILINENESIFSIKSFLNREETTISNKRNNKFIKSLSRFLPKIKSHISNYKNYAELSNLLSKKNKSFNVLVIGSGIEGKGLKILKKNKLSNIIYSDVSYSPNIDLICDAHDLPFAESSFDAVICQAVLEHVIDPFKCVEEIFRVLKLGGYVYAETPFMQQVHMAPYDFTRFTYLGHRRLFRKFEEINSGICCGPGMALAWSYQYFLMSFFESKLMKKLVRYFAICTSFFLSYFDPYLIKKSGSLDAASAYFFTGIKSKKILSDKVFILENKR